MKDIENRLREAMRSASEPPPADLKDGIRARHRRHIRRVAATWTAAAVVLAGGAPAVAHAVAEAGQRSAPLRIAQGGLAVSAPPTASSPTAAPGTVLAGCDSADMGLVDWRPGTPGRLGTSPLWFLSSGHDTGKVELYAGLMVLFRIRPGSTVVVKVAPSGQGQLRFLFGPGDSLSPGTRYTSSSGETGVTFVACSPTAGSVTEPHNATVYRGGFLVAAGRCVPVEIWWNGTVPVRASLGACSPTG